MQKCIDLGAIPYFVSFLQRFDSTDLQFEASWALTNIASTAMTRVVVDSGAVPHLVTLLNSPTAEVREQCAWCLGNISGDGPEFRDFLLSYNPMPALLANITQPASLSLLRNCTWSLSNLCRGKPQPPVESVAPALPILAALVQQNPDQDVVIDAMWALSYASDGEDRRIQSVVDTGVVPALVQNLHSGKATYIVPALRTLGNIVSGNEHQTQAVLSANVLAGVAPLLSHGKKNIRKETCWMLSNIAAGTLEQMHSLFTIPDLLPRVLEQLSSSTEWDVRKEAAWVVSNIATAGEARHIVRLVEHGAIRPICELLDVGEARVVMIALEALEAILKLEKTNPQATGHSGLHYATLVDEAGGVDGLERLQEHTHEGIYQRAVRVIETYFGCEDDEEVSENLAPAVDGNSASYLFGAPVATGNPALDFGSKFIESQSASAPFQQPMNANANFQQPAGGFAANFQFNF